MTQLICRESQRNFQKYGEKIKCRKGCSQCCSQIFRITQVDAFVIKDHVRKLSDTKRQMLIEKAESYKNEITAEGKDFFEKPMLECPALGEDGSCTIYEARPVICQRFGPPVYDYKNPGTLHACELNFSNGEEILDDELIPAQTLLGIKWDEIKTNFNRDYGLNENASTTIAEAILNCK